MGEKYNVITLRYKYRGLIDYQRLYREGKRFFTDRKFKLEEGVYKDKGNEVEGEWTAKNKMDAYHLAIYSVKFKAIDMAPVVKDGKTMYNGKLQIVMTGDLEMDYKQETPAGKQVIFHDEPKESWLHKVYKKVTFRDRDQKLEEDIWVTVNKFQTLMKEICDSETK